MLVRIALVAAIIAALMLSASDARACQFNTDCEVGSRCLKKSGSLYGACVGGLSPGNSNDRQPVEGAVNPNYGDTCQFNTDCGPGLECHKPGSGLYGTCLRRR